MNAPLGNIKALIEYVLSEMQKHGYDQKARDQFIEQESDRRPITNAVTLWTVTS